jgi:hypothetical protein
MMSPETLAGMLDPEIERAIERLRQAKLDLDRDLRALRTERKRRLTEPPPPPPVDELTELLARPSYFIHCHFRGGYERLKAPPKDRPSLAIVEIDRFQYTATYNDSQGRLVCPPAVFPGHTDWDVVGSRDGSTFFRRDRKRRPPPPEVSLCGPGEITSAEWRKKMGIPDDTPA